MQISIENILGFGSMGMVYHGRIWDHHVVVKMIEHGNGLLGKQQLRKTLARVEATVSRMLRHPNIVTTFDCCTGVVGPQQLLSPEALARGQGGGGGGGGKGGVRERVMTVIVQVRCMSVCVCKI